MKVPKIVLSIAGTDSSGGAGIGADLAVFRELNLHGCFAITAMTAQNTTGVRSIEASSKQFLADQIDMVLEDLDLSAIKTGMLFSAELIELVALKLKNCAAPLVVDPVMLAKSKAVLLQKSAISCMKSELISRAFFITPNLDEAALLVDGEISSMDDMKEAARILQGMGARNVIIKGGHREGSEVGDLLLLEAGEFWLIKAPRIDTKNTHGTGCSHSAALAGFLARGLGAREAAIFAKRFVHLGILHGHGQALGHGHAPINWAAYKDNQGILELGIERL